MQHVLSMILRGLVTVVPVAATLYLVVWLAVSAEWLVGLAFKAFFPDAWYLPGVGLALALPLLYGIGWAVDHWLLKGAIGIVEDLLARTPLVNKIFAAVRDLISYFTRDQTRHFDQVVSFELAGIRLLGLVTREDLGDLPEGLRSTLHAAVYVPGSYQIGGFTVNVPRERLIPVTMAVEDALRYAVSGGMSYQGLGAVPRDGPANS